MDRLVDFLLPRWARAIAINLRLRGRPGREMRATTKEYDARVEAAQRRLVEAERRFGEYDARTGEARAELERVSADSAALDEAWGVAGKPKSS
jgi:hypothetical protein